MKIHFLPLVILTILTILFSSCTKEENISTSNENENQSLFTLINSSESGIDFSNTIRESVRQNITNYDYYYNGSGVAIGDIDNDGLPDIFFTGNNVPNRLYLNKGDFKFTDISEITGIASNVWSTGVTMVDINQDGLLDIYVCNSAYSREYRNNHLYINNGDLTFSEKAAEYGIDNSGFSTQSSFFDYDKDGDLDLLLLNHSVFQKMNVWLNRVRNMSLEEQHDHAPNLYRNNGNNTFTNVSQQAGILKPGFGLGLATADLNHDGWTDIYIANDYFVPDYMFLNAGNGTFKEEVKNKTAHTSYYSMGVDAADFNNDGLLDLGVVDMTPGDHKRNKLLMASMNVDLFRQLTDRLDFQNQYMFNTLQVNTGDGVFSEIGLLAGLAKTDWSWAALFADFDNDGLKDYLVTNGFRKDTKNNDWRMALREVIRNSTKEEERKNKFEHLQKAESNPVTNFIYKNNGDYQFEDKSEEWGFTEPSFSNGVAYADLDKDGDLDLVVNNIDQEAFVYKNNAIDLKKNNFIRFEVFKNKAKQQAYNSKVTIYHGAEMQYAELRPVRGYLSAMEPTLHFGLGKTTTVDSVKIQWLDGTHTTLKNLKVNKTHQIFQDKVIKKLLVDLNIEPLFESLPSSIVNPTFKHQENDFDDFEKEILLPHRQSMLGPFVSVGDVNGDQNDDFFIGGAKGQSARLYLQNEKGQFSLSPSQPWENDIESEDMGSLLFDSDGDGDLDLYVASGGGGEFRIGERALQDRLYINKGNGIFQKSVGALPKMQISSGQVKAADFDNDGDADLFVAGRTLPGKYPYPTDSYLLRNDNNTFTDVTEELAPELRQLGMITDATWTDFDKDGLVDLFVVGEWMPVTCFKNKDGKLERNNESSLSEKTGWWRSIIAEDFDQDGDMDFIVGNVGKNNKYQPTTEKPLHIFCNDFDENGSLDIVLSKLYHNNLVPVRGKECSTAQMPFVSDNFPTFKSFSESSLSDIYGEEKLEEALHYTVNSFESTFLENRGEAGFVFHDLPMEAQFAPVNAILPFDFDKDGILDLVIAGNDFETEVETPRYDAGKGLFLKGKGDGTYTTSVNAKESGVMLKGNTKDLKLISLGKEKRPVIIVGNNNGEIQFLSVKK